MHVRGRELNVDAQFLAPSLKQMFGGTDAGADRPPDHEAADGADEQTEDGGGGGVHQPGEQSADRRSDLADRLFRYVCNLDTAYFTVADQREREALVAEVQA